MNILARVLGFNSSRRRLWLENAAFAAAVPRGAVVLDAGSGAAPYQSLFSHARYESADFEQVKKRYAATTYVCDLNAIPVENARFDVIVCNQVLEHVPEPKAVLHELHRVLKPGGSMIYTGPLFYEEHEQPFDFYRYTQFGLRYLFGEAGFIVQRLDWLEGYFGTVGYQLNGMARHLPWTPADLGGGLAAYAMAPAMLVLKVGFAACSVVFHLMETRHKFQSRGYPKNYVAVLTKGSADRSPADGNVADSTGGRFSKASDGLV